ncbi:hypothetical protein A3B61_04865 [Candidatus Peribacteria bacterium RIFCSPLOWO2_01_FULL_53_10]|nr:MAG: hypothetical protein A3B61_04865 [Candidatus Peribacteria bacterium RIFCSPLOWO2_01_FULL_53_10]
MTELHLIAIEDDGALKADSQHKAPGSFAAALRLSQQKCAHREGIRGLLRMHTVEEFAAAEAAEEEEHAAAAKYDTNLRERMGRSFITANYLDDMADQFGHYDPSHPSPKQEHAWQ